MLSLPSYEHVRRSVSLIIHLVSVSFAVSEFSDSAKRTSNSPPSTKILVFAVKYMT